jgi:uncharacterized membrane protein
MGKGRLEAFSDGVLAIIITIMVLELKVPHGTDWAALQKLSPTFLSYVLSFVYVGIYWNNHHHLLQATRQIKGPILWANSHLLFWLSLIPFVTGWMGENHFAQLPVAMYGVVLLMSAVAFKLLIHLLLKSNGPDSELAKALGNDFKGTISPILYSVAIALSFWNRWLALGIYVLVAIIWFIPDSRIEKTHTG